MGRLTKRLGDQVILKDVGITDCGKICDRRKDFDIPCDECPIDDAFRKLAHYEDLEKQLMESAEIDIDNMVGEFMHDYKLKKENRLIELPCAVGDTAYFITVNAEGEYVIGSGKFSYSWLDYPRIIYATKEEAKAKLKELEGDDK